jgi:outer membrane protein assembly factor BamB
LICTDDKGALKWSKDLAKDMKGEVNPIGGGPENFGWGYSWSPLVDGDNLILAPGGPDGLLAAVKKTTGDLVWRTKDIKDQATYSSPIKVTIADVPQYIYVTQANVYGVGTDGKELWKYVKEKENGDVVCPTPIYHDGHVFITGWKGNSELFKVTKPGAAFKAENVATNKKFVNFYGGVVLVDKDLYGSHDRRSWKCVDFATLADKWESRELPVGSVTAADGHLYCFTEEEGIVALVEASPKAFTEKGRFELPEKSTLRKGSGKFWTPPVIANGHLYLRDQEWLFCYKIK